MVLELRQQLKLSQQLVMTPQLQQAIKLLQLSRLELAETLQQEMEQNPTLEEDFGSSNQEQEVDQDAKATTPEAELASLERTSEVSMDDNSSLKEINWEDYTNEYEPSSNFKQKDANDLPSRLDILTKKPGLDDHLLWQLKFSDFTPEEEEVGVYIIGNIDRDGFLQVDNEEIAQATNSSLELVERTLAKVQQLDPPGVAARGLQESLLLQLGHLNLGKSFASQIVRHHLHYLETKNYAAIAKATGHAVSDVVNAVNVIIGLNPHPGRAFSDDEPHYIIPDVHVYKVGEEYVILLNDEGLPRLKVSAYYQSILKDKSNTSAMQTQTKNYIQEKLKSAVWLIKSIQQRQRTIYKVVESLIKFQRDFFEHGIAHLKPLILRDVAEDVEMHESTISRVTSNKYVHTPQGTFELKYFFNSSIERNDGGDSLSSASIKARIRQITQGENPEKPMSDMAIADIFARDNIQIARRTIAKYREQLGILPSKFRKKARLK